MSDPLPSIDTFTAETIRNMIKYISDDDRIARHVGVHVSKVRRLREAEAEHAPPTYAPQRKQQNENLNAANDPWINQTRRSTRALAEALAKSGGRL